MRFKIKKVKNKKLPDIEEDKTRLEAEQIKKKKAIMKNNCKNQQNSLDGDFMQLKTTAT